MKPVRDRLSQETSSFRARFHQIYSFRDRSNQFRSHTLEDAHISTVVDIQNSVSDNVCSLFSASRINGANLSTDKLDKVKFYIALNSETGV